MHVCFMLSFLSFTELRQEPDGPSTIGAIAPPHPSHFPQVGGVGAAPQDYETYRDLQVTTRGLSWGHSTFVVGAIGSFLSRFVGIYRQNLTRSLTN